MATSLVAVDAQAQQAIGDHNRRAPVPTIDENYYAGYLTWTDSGKIRWSPEGIVERGGGGRDLATYRTTDVGWTLRTNSGNRTGSTYQIIDTFVSDPLPATLYVNGSRPVSLQMCWDGNLPTLDVQILADGRLLAGGLSGMNTPSANPYPPGRCTQLSMRPEMDRLDAGSTISVRVSARNHIPGNLVGTTPPYIFKYAVSPPSNPLVFGYSVLHIPFFPDYELALRAAEADPLPESGGGQESSASDAARSPSASAWPILGIIAFFGLAARRGRFFTTALVVCLLAAAFAGCLQDSAHDPLGGDERPVPTGGTATYSLQPQSGPGSGPNGSVVGEVSNANRQAVVGAHVSMLNTSFFTDTTRGGRFQFQEVAPGSYEYRVEATGYKVFEGKLVVSQGNITVVKLTVESLVDRKGDFAPHRHDLWLPDSTKLIYAGQVTFPVRYGNYYDGELPNRAAMCVQAGNENTDKCMVDLRLRVQPGNPIILPGAREIEVVIRWNQAGSTLERAGIAFTTPNAKLVAFGYDEINFMYPRPSGVPTRIQLGWELTDNGHAKYTAWNMFVYVPANPGTLTTPSASAQLSSVPFDVEIKQHKGVVPLEPGHRDWWGRNTTLNVLPLSELLISCTASCPWPKFGFVPQVVPADTEWLELVLEQSAAREPFPPSWGILYHPGNRPLDTSNTYAASHFNDYVPMERPTKDGLRWTFRQPLPAAHADAVYAQGSNMAFAFTDLGPRPPGDVYPSSSDATTGTWRLYLNVTAHQSPLPG